MNLKELEYKELVSLFKSGQGDMTLIVDHPNRVTDKELVKKCFSELLRRQSIMQKEGRNHGKT
jgi:hypothetical protein